MENIAEIPLAHMSAVAKTRKEKEEAICNAVDIAPSPKVMEVKTMTERDEGVPLRAPAVPVLAERNIIENNNPMANSTNKMVSPVLLKLRRNQEKRVTPANPVDPVQVPPKQFLGFPADRYTSPTDSIMSPISRGLLARSRRLKRLPPACVPPKALDHTFQDTEFANDSSS